MERFIMTLKKNCSQKKDRLERLHKVAWSDKKSEHAGRQ